MINYKEYLILFNKLKHKTIRKKFNNTSEAINYFCAEDFDAINRMTDKVAEKVWGILYINLINGYHGLSKETCTFCIHTKVIKKGCNYCHWGRHHKLCIDSKGGFKKLKKLYNNYNQLTNKDYIKILNTIRKNS